MRRFLAVVALVLGTMASLWWWQRSVLERLRAECAATEQRSHALNVALQQSQTRRERAEKVAANTRAEREALASRTVSEKPTPPAAAASPKPRRKTNSIADLIRDEPDAQVLYLEASRAGLQSQYGPFFRQARLTPDEIGRFQEIYLRRDAQLMDIGAALDSDDPAEAATAKKLNAEARAAYKQAQRELLGTERAKEFEDYERSTWARRTISAIVGAATVEGVPYTADQADQLVRILHGVEGEMRGDAKPSRQQIDWEAVDGAVKKVLTPEQFAVFRTMDPGPTYGGILQWRLYEQVGRVNSSAQEAAKKSDATPPR